MTPYASFYFFIITAILLIPSIVAGLRGKSLQWYNSIVTVVMLAIIFTGKTPKHGIFAGIPFAQGIWLIIFTVLQVLLIKGYLALRKRNNQAITFYLAVIFSIIPLLLVKILPVNTVGFLGISYLTFKSVQMIMEIRDGQIKAVSLYRFLRFLLFFPTITSGPIDRYRRFEKDIAKTPSKEEYKELIYLAINRIFQGFLYKFIIAYLLDHYLFGYAVGRDITLTHFLKEDGTSFFSTLMSMYAYSLYLFFDFAGYSSFAIGVSYLMGIKTPENFNKPFVSRNIKDFWNRWHMSLSFWFRDYVYMRFVFFMTKKKWLKNRYTISNIGFFLNFLLMGVWHGLQVNYIIYGLYHALLFVLFDWFERQNKKHKFWPQNKFMHVLAVVITFHAVAFGFLIFSGKLI